MLKLQTLSLNDWQSESVSLVSATASATQRRLSWETETTAIIKNKPLFLPLWANGKCKVKEPVGWHMMKAHFPVPCGAGAWRGRTLKVSNPMQEISAFMTSAQPCYLPKSPLPTLIHSASSNWTIERWNFNTVFLSCWLWTRSAFALLMKVQA